MTGECCLRKQSQKTMDNLVPTNFDDALEIGLKALEWNKPVVGGLYEYRYFGKKYMIIVTGVTDSNAIVRPSDNEAEAWELQLLFYIPEKDHTKVAQFNIDEDSWYCRAKKAEMKRRINPNSYRWKPEEIAKAFIGKVCCIVSTDPEPGPMLAPVIAVTDEELEEGTYDEAIQQHYGSLMKGFRRTWFHNMYKGRYHQSKPNEHYLVVDVIRDVMAYGGPDWKIIVLHSENTYATSRKNVLTLDSKNTR